MLLGARFEELELRTGTYLQDADIGNRDSGLGSIRRA
jgi:hypothetical protein